MPSKNDQSRSKGHLLTEVALSAFEARRYSGPMRLLIIEDDREALTYLAKAFREAVQEAATFMQNPKNNDKVRAAIGKYIQLPPEVIARMQISPPGPVVSEKQLSYWVRLMKDQEMLKTEPKVAQLIAK